MDLTVIWVPCFPAHGFGSALWPGFGGTSFPSEYTALLTQVQHVTTRGPVIPAHLQAQLDSAVFVVTVRCAIMLMLASASPRNP